MTRSYLASDQSLAVDMEAGAVAAMVELCTRSGRLETGGVLIGRYSRFGDRVVVTKVTGPPRDSHRFPFSFVRGIAGLTRRLGREWVEGAYYVGEWHFHPFASPTPSPLDIKQIMVFAADAELHCPRPVLLVFGGDPRGGWSLSVAVVMEAGLVFLAGRT